MKNFEESISKMNFEEALAELERIVSKLESGKESLESAINDYEYGNACGMEMDDRYIGVSCEQINYTPKTLEELGITR